MKSLVEYILSSKKTYEFKIKLAVSEVPNEMLDRIEHALSSFGISQISKPKHLPITARNLDFPAHGPCDIFLITVVLTYPCTDAQVRDVLGSQGRIPLSNIVVIPVNQPEELRREEEAELELHPVKADKKVSLLNSDIEVLDNGQPKVGTKRIESMMKEIESRKTEFAAKQESKLQTTNDFAQNTTSPLKGIKK